MMPKTRLLIILIARSALNVSFRMVYPFLPSIARGLGISLGVAGSLVTLRMIAGMLAPILGPVADRYDRRTVMILGLGVFTLANLLLAGTGTLTGAIIAFAGFGLAKVLYDPTMLAYVGDTVPYQERGRAHGIIELTWSAGWLIGVPVSGFLIERYGWQSPWAALVGYGLLGIALTRFGLPSVPRRVAPLATRQYLAFLLATWRQVFHRPGVPVLLLTSVLFSASIEIPFIVYGAWLETDYGLSLSTVGVASIVVGLAEAAAEFGTVFLTDRLGKRRSVLLGLAGLALTLAALPTMAQLGLVGGLAGIVLVMLTFEFGIVSLLPLMSEAAPDARASLLSLNVTAFSVGRTVGAMAGAWLWESLNGGLALNAGVGAAGALLAALLVRRRLVEIRAEEPRIVPLDEH